MSDLRFPEAWAADIAKFVKSKKRRLQLTSNLGNVLTVEKVLIKDTKRNGKDKKVLEFTYNKAD
jgi:hypothetical protein